MDRNPYSQGVYVLVEQRDNKWKYTRKLHRDECYGNKKGREGGVSGWGMGVKF